MCCPLAKAQASKESDSMDGYSFSYSETECDGSVCTLSLGGAPVVRNRVGDVVPETELVWLDILPGGRLNASLRGSEPMLITPYVEVCKKGLCQNLSVTSDILGIRQILDANWTFETSKHDLGNHWEYTFNLSSVPVGMKRLVLRYDDSPYYILSFDDVKASGIEVKEERQAVSFTLTKDTTYIDPTISLGDGNITDDTSMSERDPTNEFGADDDLTISGDWADVARQYPIVRFGGLNLIPRGSMITNATVQMYIENEMLDGTGENWTVYAFHVYQPPAFTVGGGAWTEGDSTAAAGCVKVGVNATGTEMNWVNGPWLATQGNITYESSAVIYYGSLGWNNFSVTNMVKTEYDLNNSNVTINFEVGFVGSPDDTDCARYTSSEGTAAQRPRLNITYNITMPKWSLNQTNSTVNGSDVKHSVNWTAPPPNTTMSGYIFQFCNGTWNGTLCLPYIPKVTTTITLQSPTGENLADLTFRNSTAPRKYSSQIMWNISSIPSGSTGIDAKLCVYVQRVYAGSNLNANIRLWGVNDQTWGEGSSAATITSQAVTNQTDTQWNVTPTNFIWICTNATNMIATDYAAGNKNSTIRFNNETYNPGTPFKVDTTYDALGLMNMLGGSAGAPGITCSDRENATASVRPILYISYSNANATPEAWVNDSFAYFSGSTWSNVTKTVNSTVGANIAWRVYANSTGDGGARWNATDIFNYTTTEAAPSTDATFSIAMPSEYDWDTVTGTAEGSATALVALSFNFTSLPQTQAQPYAEGIAAKTQSGTKLPILYMDPTGTAAMDFNIRLNQSAPTGITLKANATCTSTYDICSTGLLTLTSEYQTLVNEIATTGYVNVTIYADLATGTPVTVASEIQIYINGSID